MKQPKYKNRKVEANGKVFDSVKEAKRYRDLSLLQRANEIHSLECQVKFILADSVKFSNEARAKPAIRYFADFAYYKKDGVYVVEDVKSAHTKTLPEYRIKRHLMLSVHGIEVVEV